jgi:hypothetical protein
VDPQFIPSDAANRTLRKLPLVDLDFDGKDGREDVTVCGIAGGEINMMIASTRAGSLQT